MITQEQQRELEREKNSLEQLCQLQSEKIARIQKALIIETDPSRKFQYEQQIQEEECTLKELSDKLYKIENQLQPAPLTKNSKLKKIQQKILILSEKPAKVISQYINYTIGMNQPIKDQAAIVFAQGFYHGLGYKILDNQDIFQRAFDEGIVAIQMENLAQGQIPVLKKKVG